jgi:hypothetical protein
MHAAPAHVAAILGAGGAPLVLAARRRLELLAGLVLLGAAELGLAYANTGGGRVSTKIAAAGVFALAVIAAAGWVLARRPELIAPLVLLAAPFRLPLDFNRHHRFFVAIAQGGQLGRLLPLYLVLAAATAAFLIQLVRGAPLAVLPRTIAWPAGAFLALASLSLLWSGDLAAGVNLLEFFLLPFALLVAVVARAPFPAWLPRTLATVGIALGCLFAVIGIWQAATHKLLFFAPKLEVANSYASFFRVTSLFRDPSLYGRHVVLAMAVVLVPLWLRRLNVLIAAALLAVLWLGLYFSYSQSSMVALFVVVLAVVAAAGGRRARLAVLAGAVVTLLVAAGVGAAELRHHSAQRATSDRSRRVGLTARAWEHRPLAGVGIGSQPRASQKLATRYGPASHFVSHTTPLTVAAELGTIGLLLYLVLLAGAAKAIDEVRRRDPAVGLTLGMALLALFVHSLFYSGFFEDPLTWFVLAVTAAAVLRPAPAPEPVPPAPAREPVLAR